MQNKRVVSVIVLNYENEMRILIGVFDADQAVQKGVSKWDAELWKTAAHDSNFGVKLSIESLDEVGNVTTSELVELAPEYPYVDVERPCDVCGGSLESHYETQQKSCYTVQRSKERDYRAFLDANKKY